TDLGSPVMIGLTTMFWWWGNSVLLEHLPRSRRDQMFIAMSSVKLITAPAEPNVAATRAHRAPLERGLEAGGGYKHLAAPRPIHYYPTTQTSAYWTRPRACAILGAKQTLERPFQFHDLERIPTRTG